MRQIVDELLCDRAVGVHGEAEVDHIAVEAVNRSGERPEHSGTDVVVAVDKDEILARGRFEADVARIAQTAVRLVNDADPLRMRRSVAVTDCAALTVGGTVVHKHQLVVVEILRQYGVDAFGQIVFYVIDGDNNAENHAVFSSPSGSASGCSLRICVK